MFGELPSREKPLLEVALLGASGSGTTTLAHALAARTLHRRGLPASRRRPKPRPSPWPSLDAMETPSRRYALFDWSGEAAVARGLMDHLGRLSGAVLVASAADGAAALRPRDVWLARQVGVPSFAVFLTRADAVAPQQLEWLEAEVRMLLHAAGYAGDDVPVLAGDAWSALCSCGASDAVCRPIDDLIAALEHGLSPPEPAVGKPFRMAVEEVSYLRRGLFTVATGRIQQGRVEVGDRIAVAVPQEPTATPRVAGLRRFHQSLECASAGDRVGVLLRRQTIPPLAPGHILCRPGAVAAPRRFEALAYQPAIHRRESSPLRDGAVRLGFGGHEANGRCQVVGPTPGTAAVGQPARVCIDVDGAPAAVYEGMRFEMRHGALTALGVVARVI